ncbi:MAG: helix-turn-helix domain-containing protein [Deltaproteobacteria bacterium]|nr:helix-turn-helix domain-containing protein [Deltaproteobacteria bacterium]
MGWYGYGWRPYVPVAVRRARSLKKLEKLQKKGLCIRPVEIAGRKIAQSFWGQAWCDHLEKFSDYANRLPRGRTYVRNGSVCHLEIAEGAVKAMVSGSELYNVDIEIKKLPAKKWADVKKRCAGQIGSLLELLQGKLSKSVMAVVTDRDKGLFPNPGEITLHCSCPDWAVMCKHVAAALYGVGARLDEKPELLFLLRGLDHEELISAEAGLAAVSSVSQAEGHMRIAESDLSNLFGIEMTQEEDQRSKKPAAKRTVSAGKEKKPALRARTSEVKSEFSGKRKKAPKAADKPRKKKGQDRDRMDRKETGLGLASKKSQTRSKRAVPLAPKSRAVTGKAVARLRKKFNMSQAEFARLLEVSPATVGNWEKSEGPINMRARARMAWNAATKFKKTQVSQRPV